MSIKNIDLSYIQQNFTFVPYQNRQAMPNKQLNTIGLDIEKLVALGKQLNGMLADFQLYYQNLRGFH